MKYWFFNGSDVVGPFTPQALSAEKAFNESSLVCPEAFSDKDDRWQPASSFEDFKPFFAAKQEPQNLSLEQEMDTLLCEKSPLAFEKTDTDNASLQLPKKPNKPGPIEEYFNHIEKEDLGDILGIPAPAENSDMDLAHALEHQLAKTSSTRRRTQELTAVDEQTVAQLEASTELPEAQQTHHVATATEVFATHAPVSTTVSELEDEFPTSTAELPVLPENDFEGMPSADTAPLTSYNAPTEPTILPYGSAVVDTAHPVPAAEVQDQPEELVSQEPSGTNTSKTASSPTQPPTSQHAMESNSTIEDPALLRSGKLEVNSIKAHLKQTQEMKNFVEAQTRRVTGGKAWERPSVIFLVATVVIIGTLFALRQLQARPVQPVAAQPAPASVSTAQELLAELPHPAAAETTIPASKSEQALSIVRNYPLSDGRGALGNYLNTIYQTQLAQGYVGDWDAQPLHKNTYIVKYRLTKTRKEPIIYIFQADVAKGKLTGALNNISLDLVGKI